MKRFTILGTIICLCLFVTLFVFVNFMNEIKTTENSDEETEYSDEEIIKKNLSVTIYSMDYYSNDMHYKMFYTSTGDPFVVNLTKDSLECEYYRNAK